MASINRADLERTDFSDIVSGERLAPVTPGEVLREEFMAPHGLSARALARELDVPPNRITEILNGERSISAETALLLARRFGTSAEFWMNLQTAHDLELAREAMVGRAA
jgi:addiction module HigA family antidote